MEQLAQSIIDLENLKNYINNIQNIPNPNNYVLGFKIGIILSEVSKIQDRLSSVRVDNK